MSRFTLGALLLTDPVIAVLRREIRRLSPEVRIDVEEIRAALVTEVLKREVMEGEKAMAARKQVSKTRTKATRANNVAKEAEPMLPGCGEDSEPATEARQLSAIQKSPDQA